LTTDRLATLERFTRKGVAGMTWGWLIPIVAILAIFGLPALVRLTEGRRKFLLDLRKEERLIAEAKARELELEHKRRELEYREALLELEKFDRRAGKAGDLDGPDRDEPGPS
jgi:hypothetical protein